MADIYWIKVATSSFKDEKIKLIKAMPKGDAIIVMWFNLLCLAGDRNLKGYIVITQGVPYTVKSLSSVLGYNISLTQRALSIFQELKMIEIDDNGILILNWEKHQNIDGMEKIREQNRIRQKNYYAKVKNSANETTILTLDSRETNAPEIEIEKEIEIDIEPNIQVNRMDIVEYGKVPFDFFWNLYDKKIGSISKLTIKWNKLSKEEQENALDYIPIYKDSRPDKQYRKKSRIIF
jgi:predicted phage replisome organizer